MSPTVSRVYLQEGISGRFVEAHLYDCILPRHLEDHELYWKPSIRANAEQHGHWDWRKKWAYYSKQLSYEFFALECAGITQGMTIVNTTKRCRLASQANQHQVYVEYLEAAPWNRGQMVADPQYKGVGRVLIAAAIELSMQEGNRGRIGLHSLPQADTFYRNRCGMTDLGLDVAYSPEYPLRYFEMTEAQAVAFLKGTRS